MDNIIKKTKFEIYLEKFCALYDLTPEEALQHKTVQDVKAYYDTMPAEGGL